MKHNRKGGNLSRTSAHRDAMFANMATSLIMHKRINTTVAKAKALKRYVEPVITKAKVDSTHSRRIAFSYLRDKDAVSELFRVVSPAVGTRPGGYTRILKTGFRQGDGADMCFIELVDFNDVYSQESSTESKPRTRRGGAGRGRRGSGAAQQDAAATKETESQPKEATEKVAKTEDAKAKETKAKAADKSAEAKKESADSKKEEPAKKAEEPKAEAKSAEKKEEK